MLPDPQQRVLTRRFQQRIAAIGDRAAGALGVAWSRLDTHDEADIDTFATATAPVLASTRSAAASLGVGYYALLLQVRPPSIPPEAITVAADVRAPFIAYWRALKMGHPLPDAVESGALRAAAVARNFAVSTSRRAGDLTARAADIEIVSWRRTPDGGACEWCRGLTVYLFDSAEQADFGHDRCGCTPLPVPA